MTMRLMLCCPLTVVGRVSSLASCPTKTEQLGGFSGRVALATRNETTLGSATPIHMNSSRAGMLPALVALVMLLVGGSLIGMGKAPTLPRTCSEGEVYRIHSTKDAPLYICLATDEWAAYDRMTGKPIASPLAPVVYDRGPEWVSWGLVAGMGYLCWMMLRRGR